MYKATLWGVHLDCHRIRTRSAVSALLVLACPWTVSARVTTKCSLSKKKKKKLPYSAVCVELRVTITSCDKCGGRPYTHYGLLAGSVGLYLGSLPPRVSFVIHGTHWAHHVNINASIWQLLVPRGTDEEYSAGVGVIPSFIHSFSAWFAAVHTCVTKSRYHL